MPRLLVLALLLTPLAAAPVPVPKVAQPPALDGRLDDPCWQGPGWQSGFRLLDATGREPEAQTEFRLAHDGRLLYFAARLHEPKLDSLRAEVTERDGPVSRDDCVELMIDADADRVDHFHVIVNARGTVYDAHVRQGGNVRSVAWNADIRAATGRETAAWTVELALPLVELGLGRGSLGAWGFNVGRERMAGGTPELSSFAPTVGGFHQPTQFAPLQLQGAALEQYLWEVSAPDAPRVVLREGQRLLVTQIRVGNATGQVRRMTVRASLAPGTGVQEQEVGLPITRAQGVALAVPVSELGPATLVVTVADPKTGEARAVRQFALALEHAPLALRLTTPSYRQSVYATQALRSLRGEAAFGLDEAALQGRRLRLAVAPEGGEQVAGAVIDRLRLTTPFALAVPALSPGRYTVTAELLDARGRVVHEAATPLRVLGAQPGEIRIDEHGVTRIDNEPYLPFGWFSTPQEQYALAAAEGNNAVVEYNAQYYPAEVVRAQLDRAAAAGLRVIIYPYPSSRMMTNEAWARPLSDEEAEALRQRVRSLKDHPGLLALYLADEPELRPALPSRLEAIRAVIAEEDPFHPTIMLNDSIEGIRTYARGGDVLMPDPYPLFLRGGVAAREIGKVSEFIAAARDAADGQAVWITPQAFNYGDYGRLNNRAPSFTELRNMMVQAVIEGATGFLWYTWSHRANYPSLRLGMPYLAREAQLLKRPILAPQTSRALSVAPEGAPEPVDAPVRAVWRQAVGHQYVFAVSTATRPGEAVLVLPAGAPGLWHVVGEQRTVRAQSGRLRDAFGPYDSHVYTTNPALAAAVDRFDVDLQISDADRERVRPGNLAFEDRGTRVSVSSKATYGSTPDRLVDGVRDGMGWRDATAKAFPDWAEVTFGQPQRVARVEVWSPTVAEAHVEVKDGDAWRKVAPLTRQGERLTAAFEPVTTSALRVVFTASDEPTVWVTEVEVYGP